jgi:hypothetical protein
VFHQEVKVGRKEVVFIHPIYWLTAFYTSGRQEESREVSARWSRSAPDEGIGVQGPSGRARSAER